MSRRIIINPLSQLSLKSLSKRLVRLPIRTNLNHLSTTTRQLLEFPCLDKLEQRDKDYLSGPEPSYINVPKSCKSYHHPHEFPLDSGASLPEYTLVYETWGTLNKAKDNCILLHTGLSASSHARSSLDLEKEDGAGWWEKFIGPGKALDTDKFFVVCCNVIGGCYGSTGPSSFVTTSKNEGEKEGERYATNFPLITVFDMVRAQMNLIDSFGISKLYASVGASMGGMQSLAVGALFGKDRVAKIITISACAKSHPYSIAQRFVQRQVLMTDPNWNKGFYYDSKPPHVGMKLAREIATITYRSGPEWEERFGRKRSDPTIPPALCPDYLIETYLDHQGEKFCLNYDANSLLYISKAMDQFDLSSTVLQQLQITGPQVSNRLTQAVTKFQDPLTQGLALLDGIHTLVLGVQSDILFPHWQQKEIATKLKEAGNKQVHYYELDSIYGHDTFLIDINNVAPAVKGHLEHSW